MVVQVERIMYIVPEYLCENNNNIYWNIFFSLMNIHRELEFLLWRKAACTCVFILAILRTRHFFYRKQKCESQIYVQQYLRYLAHSLVREIKPKILLY